MTDRELRELHRFCQWATWLKDTLPDPSCSLNTYDALVALAVAEPLTGKELAVITGRFEPSVSKTLARMRREGLIEAADRGDGPPQAHPQALTQRGNALLRRLALNVALARSGQPVRASADDLLALRPQLRPSAGTPLTTRAGLILPRTS